MTQIIAKNNAFPNLEGSEQTCTSSCVRKVLAQYIEWTVGPLSSVTCALMFMQFTGCHQPVQDFYWPENAIDWLRKC